MPCRPEVDLVTGPENGVHITIQVPDLTLRIAVLPDPASILTLVYASFCSH